MPLKKQHFGPDEIAIYDNAVIYLRGDYWQMRMWLADERKYARFSLKTRNRHTAEANAQKHYHELMALQLNGKRYFSKTTKQGVAEYLEQRQKDVEVGQIVVGRLRTIRIHLEHWLDFIGRDTKLKELARIDCENYLHARTRPRQGVSISQTTVANEQSTINALMAWLYKRNETNIDAFDFKQIKFIDRGDESLRRSTFTEEEAERIQNAIDAYIAEASAAIEEEGNLTRAVAGYYLMIAMLTGLRPGEQRQLRWCDTATFEKNVKGKGPDDAYSLVQITVRAATSKVRKTRRFVVKDWEYFDNLFKLLLPRHEKLRREGKAPKPFAETLVFSADGAKAISARAIDQAFQQVLDRAAIMRTADRDLVPYSCRHYFITSMINRGATPTQVAETCGTSTAQIERTYYHTTEAKMITNALPQFDYRDGMLIPK